MYINASMEDWFYLCVNANDEGYVRSFSIRHSLFDIRNSLPSSPRDERIHRAGARLGSSPFDRRKTKTEPVLQQAFGDRFRFIVAGVDQSHTGPPVGVEHVEERMIGDIGGDVGLGSGPKGLAGEATARTATDGHGLYKGLQITDVAETARLQALGHALEKAGPSACRRIRARS